MKKRQHALMASVTAICFIFIGSIVFVKTLASDSKTPAGKASIEKAVLSERVSVQAAGRGNPYINLSDGHELITRYVGPGELVQALERNEARGLSLATADFDEDGVPDLASGYAGPQGGIITLVRGNVDSIYPNAPEAKRRKAEGTFTDSPFLSPASVFSLPGGVDFLGSGDFDADGHLDIVAASRGGDKLYFMMGDGRGSFGEPKQIDLEGRVTSLVTGEINRRDSLTDIVVGISRSDGPKALVFESAEGAIKAAPEAFILPAEATGLALGHLTDDQTIDLAVAAGSELVMIRGRDRKLSLDKEEQAKVSPASISKERFPSVVRSIAIGNFSSNKKSDVAMLAGDGSVHLLMRGGNQRAEKWQRQSVMLGRWPRASNLVTARVSNSPTDDLVVVDATNHQLQIIPGAIRKDDRDEIATASWSEGRGAASIDVEGEPVATLPMKMNGDAADDLVIMRAGSITPSVVLSAPNAIITVNSSADTDARDSVLTLREAILLSNGVLLKSALTAAEQAQVSGTPAPGLDEVRFNIPAGGLMGANDKASSIVSSEAQIEPPVGTGFIDSLTSKNLSLSPTNLGTTSRSTLDQSAKPQLVEAYGRLPISFEANKGQHDSRVKYLARGSGYNLFLTSNEAVLSLQSAITNGKKQKKIDPTPPLSRKLEQRRASRQSVVRMKLLNSNPDPRITELAELQGQVNYFIGNDPKKWRTEVPTYSRVKYEQVYPGIDLVYYGNQGQLEYDFLVAPGADPNGIKLSYQGIKKLAVNKSGDLVLHTASGQIVQHKPVIYQDVASGRQEVAGRYEVKQNRVGFRVEEYDHTVALVIDPIVLAYSTYLGGNGDDQGRDIAVDSGGNAYVTGNTLSTNFPTANPLQANTAGGYDVFITKLSAGDATAPIAIYSTYLGGSGEDRGTGIAADSSGNAYITGNTLSINFPTANALQPNFAGNEDAFITKLNAAGSALVYSTYLGGSGEDRGTGIAVDSAGNAYITGYTYSSNFPTANALQPNFAGSEDAFITKLNAAGSALVYSTFLGGSSVDESYGIAVDSSGNTYVTGGTSSTNFPTANPLQANIAGGQDVFITKLNTAGSALVYSTYLGGSKFEYSYSIAVDSVGNAYITGYTFSTDFPTANPLQANNADAAHYDAFITKLNVAGSALVYSTYLGGSFFEYGYSIAVDSVGNAYVTGTTDSTNFPTANPLQANNAGAQDVFIAKLNTIGSALVYSTYLGGSGTDYGYGIAVDSAGNAYATGYTPSTTFPTFKAFQANYAGGTSDAFITKIAAFNPMQPDLSITKQHSGNFTVGTNGVYTITMTNVGDVSTTDTITVTDTLPSGLAFMSGTGTNWNCSAVGQVVTCTRTTALAPNASTTITLTVSVAPAALPSVTNTVSVTTTGDTNSGNNMASDVTGVGAPCVQAISIPQTINGGLSTGSCRSPIRGNLYYADRYTFTGTAGQGVAITLSAAFDTYLYLVGPDNAILVADDDGGGGTNSRIPEGSGFFTLPTIGTYTIEATSISINQTGAYTLTLTTGSAGCSYSIAPGSQSFPSSGGSGSVIVTAGAGCNWTATSNANWITITSGASGGGNGAVNYSVAQNLDVLGRSGTVTIAGQTFTVTQSASGACSYSITPTSQDFTASGGNGVVSIITAAGCNWTATSNASFLTFGSGTTGSGNGFVVYNVAANSGIARTGTLTVAGQTFIVRQAGFNPDLRTITLTSPLPKITDPILIDGTTQPGFAGTPIIEINGVNLITMGGGNGLHILAGNSTVRGLVLNRFASFNRDSAILLTTNGNNVIEGCYLGSDPSGTVGFSPSGTTALAAGVSMRSSSGNRIGGTTFAARNLISGIDGSGIVISNGATANLVQGNYIGTDVTASVRMGFQHIGVYIQGANGNTIGGTAIGAGNLISGNIDYGVYVQDDARNNLILGNIIGGNGIGTAALANGSAGVFVYNPMGVGGPSTDNTIGGTTPAARNVISGNDPYGVVLGVGATGTLVQGNYIGTDVSGAAVLANTYGVTMTEATGSTVGGAVTGARNIISGNRLTGVTIGFLNNGQTGGTGTTIQGNFIGTNSAGMGALGNGQDGIFVEVNSVTHTIKENVIAFNIANGVRIPDVTDNPGAPGIRIDTRSNSIYSNGDLGIDLGPSGVTKNDPRDPDVGANFLQNYPALISATFMNGQLTIGGTFNSTPNSNFWLDFFSNDQCVESNPEGGQRLTGLGLLVHTNANGDASINLSFGVSNPGGFINGTARDVNGNTSEFCPCVAINGASCNYELSSSSQSAAANGGTNTVGMTTGPTCNWTAVANDSFITLLSGIDGPGNGTLTYSVQANMSSLPRTGSITFSGQNFSQAVMVNQSGATVPCTFSLSSPSENFTASGGSGTFNVTTGAGCNWSAMTDVGWISTGSTGAGVVPPIVLSVLGPPTPIGL